MEIILKVVYFRIIPLFNLYLTDTCICNQIDDLEELYEKGALL